MELYLSARCPACGDEVDYCIGHGAIGDPWGDDIIRDHERGKHDRCHINSDCKEV